MRLTFLLLLTLGSWLHAATFQVERGTIQLHTEVFGDSNIDPSTTEISGTLTMNEGVESLWGRIIIDVTSLASENAARDANMHETLESGKYPRAVYTLERITPAEAGYLLEGSFQLHGVTKALKLKADIVDHDGTLTLQGSGTLLMTDYKIEPPTLLMLFSVRDRVDIGFDVTLGEE